MSSEDISGSDSGPGSGSEDDQEVEKSRSAAAAEYEEQRLKRIRENKERMEALGLRNMASFLRVNDEGKNKRNKLKGKGKGKGKEKVDEEYEPSDDGEDEEEEEESEEDLVEEDSDGDCVSERQYQKGKKRTPEKKAPKKKKKVSMKNLMDTTYVVDEDEELQLAIALSLSEAQNMDVTSGKSVDRSDVKEKKGTAGGRKGDAPVQENKGSRKKKKQITSRVQMLEDDVILNFFRFDEEGKGVISWGDLQRMAYAHDFQWTDKQIRDMIKCFDSNGDGKLSLDDFRSIVERCNMIKRPEKEAADY